MKIKNKKIIKTVLIIVTIFLIGSIYLWYCQNVLETESYDISTDKIKSSVKIAFISDLHHKEFGKDNMNLVNKIANEKPDLIAVGGDMVSNIDTNHDVIITLLEQLVDIAPTYYALGNHEVQYVNYNKLIADIKNTGTVFLDNEMVSFSTPDMNGEKIIIGGLSEYPFYEKYAPNFENDARYFLDDFIEANKENYCVLLGHQPEYYIWKLHKMEIDLILSGHTHGGVIQLPFIGGVYAPTQNFFPEYDEGYFSSDTAQMIITSGLSARIPRINNNPEVCIVNIN